MSIVSELEGIDRTRQVVNHVVQRAVRIVEGESVVLRFSIFDDLAFGIVADIIVLGATEKRAKGVIITATNQAPGAIYLKPGNRWFVILVES